MNSLIKNNKQFFSLALSLLLSSSLGAVTVNNMPLDTIISPGEVLCSTWEGKNNYIVLEMENGNLNINCYEIQEIGTLQEVFQEVMDNSSCPFNSKGSLVLSGNIMNNNLSYMIGEESIQLRVKKSLNFVNCVLRSPDISITGNEMNFDDCFLINPQVLSIVGDYPQSDYKVIQVIFHDQPEYPTLINGQIDFKDNQTTKKIIISNVKKIRVQFIWDKNLPEESTSNPELTPILFSDPLANSTVQKPSENTVVKNSNLPSSFTVSEFIDKHRAVISDCVGAFAIVSILVGYGLFVFNCLQNPN